MSVNNGIQSGSDFVSIPLSGLNMQSDSSFQPLVPSRVATPTLAKPFFNATVISKIAHYLSIPDLCSFTQVSRVVKDCVYNSPVWEEKLKNISIPRSDGQETPELLLSDPLTILDGFTYDSKNPRLSCMKLFKCLGLFYYDLVNNPENPHVFSHSFVDPIDQARILRQLKKFSLIDPEEDNHEENISKLNSTIDLFENAALNEFERGLHESLSEKGDISKLKKYSNVLITLNGGDSCVQVFTQNHPLVFDQPKIPPLSFIDENMKLKVNEFDKYLHNISDSFNKESAKIDSIFSNTIPVTIPLFERILEENIMETISTILDSFKSKSTPFSSAFLIIIPQIYLYMQNFINNLEPGINSGKNFQAIISSLIDDFYGLYIDNYLSQELQNFTDYAESEVSKWSKEILANENATETFLWSNVSREKDKNDFLTSFKKVLLMPVSVITTNSNKSQNSSVVSLPTTGGMSTAFPSRQSMNSSPIPFKTPSLTIPPTSELDAMVAVMNNKLESIKTLFSIELAVNIIREGKESIERIGKFTDMSGGISIQAKTQCEQIFVEVIHTLGERHVKEGFSKAIQTLNIYDPKQHRKTVSTNDNQGQELSAVEPLAIFAELINIGDLIQQMIHVFYEEELALRKYVDRNDFLSPSNKSKKKFEQMLDDCVANGLSRGIDVLIDQIDFLFVTVQLGSDYNPISAGSNGGFGGITGFGGGDIGPTIAAQKVITLLSSHMTLLVGSTEKTVLDVFQQEVGLRFFGSTCKNIKRQVISTDGAITLISDLNYYYNFILSLKQKELVPYFAALKEVGQLFLIDGKDAKAIGATLSDMVRFRGIFKPEELLEFVECRKDWVQIRRDVEKVMYGFGIDCVMM